MAHFILAGLLSAGSGYLLGSISFAMLIGYLYQGVDIRTLGSGNAGMTNVLRSCGKVPAALTLLGDTLKGVAAALLGLWIFKKMGIFPLAIGGCLAGAGAVLGHIYPLYFRFRGGKAVSVSAGVLIVMEPLSLLILLGLFLLVSGSTKIVSAGSIFAAAAAPVVMIFVHLFLHRPLFPNLFLVLFIGVYILFLHRANMHRLKNGTEPKFTKKSSVESEK